MIKDSSLARWMGTLFIITMLMGMVDAYLAAPILKGPLADIAFDRNLVLLGGLMRLFMSIGVVGIAIFFYPIARRFSETVAVSYLAFRIAECVLLALGVCAHVCLIGLSEGVAKNPPSEAFFFLTQAEAALTFANTTYQMAMTILGIAGMLQCGLLYRSGLVPRWISVLGLIGYLCLFLSGPLDILGLIDTMSGLGGVLYVPGGLFEFLILPAWLFWKGYRPIVPPLAAP
jgi:hypothetical protein